MPSTATHCNKKPVFRGFRRLTVLVLLSLGARAQTAPAGQGLVPDAVELNALREFYQATGGDGWYHRDRWLQGTTLADAATWYGVTVRNGDVTRLNLAANGLAGTVPAGLGQLRALFLLSLQSNQLTGGIPPELGQLGSLQHFNLFNNQLTGSLPPALGQLGNVFYFNLFGNRLEGAIPPELGQMTQVQDLNLFNNRLEGTMPAALGQLPNLRYLNLQSNRLSGDLLPALGPLPQLRQLALFDNRFDFAQLEPLFTGPGASPRAAVFSYAPQALPADEQAIAVTSGQPFSLPSAIGGARTRYQWQREAGGAWQDLPGATAAAYPVAAAAAADAGRYRCVAVNDWVTGLTLYSRPFKVQVTRALPPDNPADNRERNWTLERSFDGDGNVVAESKQFTDALGRPTQAQARNAATQQVFAAQTVYSTGGQPVLQTLAAPINNQSFNYQENFVTAGGKPYGPANFEDGKANQPDAVDAGPVGTLGHYFSQLNEEEPLTPITGYPYSLVEPYAGPLGGTKRAAGPGDALRMGQGRESKGRDFPLRREFDHYGQLRPQFVPGSAPATLEYQGMKSVSVNADGRERIVVTNKEGQALVSCLSGAQYPGVPVAGYLSADPANPYDANAPGYQDVHIPAAGPQEVTFAAAPGQPGGSVRVVDLLTDAAQDYPVAAPDTRVTLAPGFYRFVSLGGTQQFSYLARYGNFSYTYYDDAGRVVATVAPNGLAGGVLSGPNLVRGAGFEPDPAAPASSW